MRNDAGALARAASAGKSFKRRDAQVRRERLLAAAIELYATDGFEVSLEKIAERAGVTRPTLYRNFPDREALTACVTQFHLDELAGQIALWADRDDAFILGVGLVAEKTILSGGLAKIVPLHGETFSRQFRAGVERMLAEPLTRAKSARLVREDLAASDVSRLILMVAGGGLTSYGADIKANIEESLRLLMGGLSPRGR